MLRTEVNNNVFHLKTIDPGKHWATIVIPLGDSSMERKYESKHTRHAYSNKIHRLKEQIHPFAHPLELSIVHLFAERRFGRR